uniref:EVA1 domain-containing protein n=1 Tax=Monopterus albus TaxID=43700 RepID=A0A3Q3IW22_MONAL
MSLVLLHYSPTQPSPVLFASSLSPSSSFFLPASISLSYQPERTALVFLGGVCVGLLVTLCAIVFQIHCRADCHYGNRTGRAGDSETEDYDPADLSARRRRHFERALLHATMFTSAEELDRTQRLEERERILQEIWMNRQSDISTITQSLNRYY